MRKLPTTFPKLTGSQQNQESGNREVGTGKWRQGSGDREVETGN
jgi:hypothetical protein